MAAAALAAALAGSGCASLTPAPAPGTSPGPSSAQTPVVEEAGTASALPGESVQATPTLGVHVEIVAPAALKALLGRHLDLVRLGAIAREEVDESEWARLIDATPAQVRELLRTEGYFNPTVTLERQPQRARGEPDLVLLLVNPGPRARISRVTLEVEGDLERAAAAGEAYALDTRQRWRAHWPMPEGSGFRNADWSDAKASALARLRAAGYATATWSGTAAQVDVTRNEVRLFVSVDSGPLFRLGSFDIDGLVAHDAETVRHLANVHAGVPVTETLLLDFQERLQKSGLFQSVNVTLDPDPASADAARVLVRLRESPLQSLTLGVGISANTGARASAEHLARRPFGFGVIARNKIEWGAKRQAWDGEVATHPGDRLYRNLVGVAIERLESDTDVVLSQRVRLGRTQDTTRLERLAFVEAERSHRTTALGRSSIEALSANYHGVFRDVDSVVLPTIGFTAAGQAGVGYAHGSPTPSGPFTRAYARVTGYLPLGRTWYGQARVELGQVFVRDGVVVPDSQRFRAGGDESVRGYAYRSLGPVTDGLVGSGNALFTSSVELARPISANLPSVWGAVFVDAGNAADNFQTLRPVLGYGIGVRWRSPVGPLRLDWAYGQEARRGRLHFSVGIAF